MAELSRDIQERMNNVAFRYSHELRTNIQHVLNQPKYMASGKLRSSVRVSVATATGYDPPVIKINFEEYGEYIGKRKLLWTKLPSVKKLTEWVLQQGYADGSRPVPGYTNGAPKLPAFKRAEKIAWAIAKSKRKDDSRFKRQAWKKESLPSVLKKMNSETMGSFAGHIEHLFKQSLEKGI